MQRQRPQVRRGARRMSKSRRRRRRENFITAFTGAALEPTTTTQLNTMSRRRMSRGTNERSANELLGSIFQITGLSLEDFQPRRVTGSAISTKFRISG